MESLWKSLRTLSIALCFSALLSSCVFAETLDTGLFEISIPIEMSVSWNGEDMILAVSKDGSFSPPFLQIEYGTLTNNAHHYENGMSKIKNDYIDISEQKIDEYAVTTGRSEVEVEDKIAHNYLTIIKGPNLLVSLVFLSLDSLNGGKKTLNGFVSQIVYSNKKLFKGKSQQLGTAPNKNSQ